MGKVRKLWKKYERYFLLGLVIILLASFSITGAMTQCDGQRRATTARYGGSFEVAPGERMDVSDGEFDRRAYEFNATAGAVMTPTLEYRDLVGGARPPTAAAAAWMHLMAAEAAKKAGYEVGADQLRSGIRDLVDFRLFRRGGGLNFTDATYQQWLRENYRGTQTEFEDMIREILRKDLFLEPLVQTNIYDQTYEEAYEEWKHGRERVDLEFIGLPASSFADAVAAEERTRREIEKQQVRLRDVTRAARQNRLFVSRAETKKKADGAYPADWTALTEGQPTMAAEKDAWTRRSATRSARTVCSICEAPVRTASSTRPTT